MKKLYLKVKRTLRFIFYRNLNINEQLDISDHLVDENLLNLYWNMSKADRQHSYEVFNRTKEKSEDKDLLLLSLLHDIGDELAPMNHSEYAAAILKPYVSEKTHWIVEKHGEFQLYYYAHHLGGDRNKREKYKDHKYYQATIDFCEKYDQGSFDPNYKSLPLEHFEPMVRRIFSRKPYSN